MAISLPKAFAGSPGRRRGRGVPTIEDVQTVRMQAERAPRVPDVSGTIGDAGRAVQAFGANIAQAAERQQKEYDAIKTTEIEIEFDRVRGEELLRIQKEGDPADPKFGETFRGALEKRRGELLGKLPQGISAHAREMLGLTLDGKLNSSAREADRYAIDQSRKKSIDLLGAQRNTWSAQAAREPDRLEDILADAGRSHENFAGALGPDRHRDEQAKTRRAIIEASLNSRIDSGRFDEVSQILGSGAYDADLTEQSREQLRNGMDRAQRQLLAQEDARERRSERELKRSQALNEAQLIVALDAGQDVPDSILRDSLSRQRITADGYRMLTERKAKGADASDNPMVEIDLTSRMIRNNEDIHEAILQAANRRQLSANTASKLIAENQRRLAAEGKEDFKTAEEKQAFSYVTKWLGGDSLAFSFEDDRARRVALAQREFRDRIAEGKESPRTIADDLVLKYSKNDPLPPVGYIGDTDTSTRDGVVQAGSRLRALRDGGRITQEAYEREMRILKQHADRLPEPKPTAPGAKK